MTVIRIDAGMQNVLRRLSADEYAGLEQDILSAGRAYDPLRVWDGVLIDGHHRYEICQRHGLPFDVVEVEFESEAHARVWMRRNQAGRRNLSDAERINVELENKPDLAEIGRQTQGTRTDLLSNNDKKLEPHNTQSTLAAEAGVSTGKFAQGEYVAKHAPEVWKQALAGEITVNKAYATTKKKERDEEREHRKATGHVRC